MTAQTVTRTGVAQRCLGSPEGWGHLRGGVTSGVGSPVGMRANGVGLPEGVDLPARVRTP